MERALVLYQLGSVSDALLALQDEEVALRGNAGVHAALAAVLYAGEFLGVGAAGSVGWWGGVLLAYCGE